MLSGDILSSVNGCRVKNITEIEKALWTGKPLIVKVWRGSKEVTLEIQPQMSLGESAAQQITLYHGFLYGSRAPEYAPNTGPNEGSGYAI